MTPRYSIPAWFVSCYFFAFVFALHAQPAGDDVPPQMTPGTNGKLGYLTTMGWLSKPTWDQVEPFRNGIGAVFSNGKWGAIDANGKVIIAPQFGNIIVDDSSLLRAWTGLDMKWYLPNGQPALEKNWIQTADFHEGLARVVSPEGKTGFLDRKGQLALAATWQSAGDFHEGLAWVRQEGKYGYIDAHGAAIISPQWQACGDFYEGLAWIADEKGFGYIDKTNAVIVKPTWAMAGNFSEGLSWVVSGGKYGFIGTDGAIRVTPAWDWASNFENGVARVDKDGKRGLIKPTGEVVVPAKYQEILSAGEGRFRVGIQIGNQTMWGYVDVDGTMLCEATFTYAGPFDNGVAKVQHDSRWGLIDSQGKFLTDDWDGITNFFADRAWVQKANLWGLIDRTGKIIVPPTYPQVGRFHDGFARVRTGNGFRYIDPAGTLASETWDGVGNFDGGYARVSKNRKWAIINTSGAVVGSWTDFTP